MKKALILFSLTLIGCSQPTVHLNNRYLNDSQTYSIVKSMNESGIKVVLNQHTFPQRIKDNTIIYSPMLSNPEVVDQIRFTLKAVGWNLNNVQLLVESNQWFTKNNLGLFLVPNGVDVGSGRSAVDLTHKYQSLDCTHSFNLKLYSDGQFQFESIEPNYQSFIGKWQLAGYPYLQLSHDEPYLNFYYQVEQTRTVDVLGPVKVIKLTPLSNSNLIPDCSLEYGIRG